MTAPLQPVVQIQGEEMAAFRTLRRGLARTPSLRTGLGWSLVLAAVSTAGRLAIPFLTQAVLALFEDDKFDRARLWGYIIGATFLVLFVAVASGWARVRMVRSAAGALHDLRLQGFTRVHQLSLADHNEERRGQLVSRVTSDIDTLARFLEWGALAWIVDAMLLIGVVITMFVYSWQLALVSIGAYLLALPLLAFLQKRQAKAYDLHRTRVGDVLGQTSETVAGAETIRSYGSGAQAHQQMQGAIGAEYDAKVATVRFFSVLFAITDLFSGVAVIGVTITLVTWGPFGLSGSQLVAFYLLLALLQQPIAEMTEVFDQTQIALAGWKKILQLLDREPAVQESTAGKVLPSGPLEIVADEVGFEYLAGTPVLQDVSVVIPAGADVAIVGETGSGKTTFARLLVRLADPTSGEIRLSSVALQDCTSDSRRSAVRMVPQDGFLFDTSVIQNIRYGRDDASDDEINDVLARLGLDRWVDRLPDGLATQVGERGERLSVGERQLVALARAALADPGLLVLDEATSSVDPETEQMLATAIQELASERTTVAIAHRLSTAERADLILVFADGRLVETGSHNQLVTADGNYAQLHRSWERTVRSEI